MSKADIRRVANQFSWRTTAPWASSRRPLLRPQTREVSNETATPNAMDGHDRCPAGCWRCAVGHAQAADWKQVKIPPLPAFHPQQPKRIVLDNGMVIFLQEDHELPLIDGVARIRGGSRSEPAAKAGMLDLYGEVWRTGGNKNTDRGPTGRLSRNPGGQGGNRRQRRLHDNLVVVPEGRL